MLIPVDGRLSTHRRHSLPWARRPKAAARAGRSDRCRATRRRPRSGGHTPLGSIGAIGHVQHDPPSHLHRRRCVPTPAGLDMQILSIRRKSFALETGRSHISV